LDQADRFVADYLQYVRKTHSEFSKFEYGTSEGLKTEAEFEITYLMKRSIIR